MSSKEFCTRKRQTAKNTSRKTTSRTAGIEALPSMRWERWMSWTVKTMLRTPQPMGRTAVFHTPRAMSKRVTSPAVPSILSKGFERTPSTPIEASTLAWASKIQLQVSRRTPHIHELMSSPMDAHAGRGTRRAMPTASAAAMARRNARLVVVPSMASPSPRRRRRPT